MKLNRVLPVTTAIVAVLLFPLSTPAPAQTGWGNALSLDGASDSVLVPGFGMIAPTNEITIEFWQKVSTVKGQLTLVLSPDHYTNRIASSSPWLDGVVYWDFGNAASGGRLFYTPPAAITNSWQHIAFVASQSGNFMRIYRNGVLEVQKAGISPFVRGAYDLYLGGISPNYFGGQLDEFRIWNVARSQMEIQADMNQPLTGTEPNLIACWHFNETNGTIAYDATTNHFDATLVNGPVWTNSTIPSFLDMNAGLPGVYFSAVAWGDYDNDGRLDILLTGLDHNSAEDVTQIWHNNGNATFSNATTTVAPGLPGVESGAVAWGDYDNDGYLDFLLTGTTNGSASGAIAQVWRNTGLGFTNVTGTAAPGLPGVFQSSIDWGDYDNDGWLDSLLTGHDGTNATSQIWHNNGDGTFSNVTDSVASGLPGVYRSSVAWSDYDNDSRLDFLLTGNDGTNDISRIWHNNGDGTFSDVTATVTTGLPGVRLGSVAWGDYDNDGWLDFLLTGIGGSTARAQVWLNTGSGFTNVTALVAPGLTGVFFSSVAWGDFDNDGKLDFLLTGNPGGNAGTSQVWRNTGSGFTNVTENLVPDLPGVNRSSVAWGDYDNDGRLDILLTGPTNNTTSSSIAQVWRNNGLTTNTPPTSPINLTPMVDGSAVTLDWNAATDGATPVDGLTYNLRVGTTSGGFDVVSPEANPTTGFRRLPAPGSSRPGVTALLTNLPNSNYFWSVQAVDTAFAGSPFASEGQFVVEILAPEVTTQPATGLLDTATLNGTVNPGNLPTAAWFEWGTTTNYGIGTSVTNLVATNVALLVSASVNGLIPGTPYHFRLVATNRLGSTFGNDLIFRTGGLTNLVSNTNDSGPGSLRETIANSLPGDIIHFSNTLSGATILLTSGELLLTNNLTIDASTLTNGLAIDGNTNTRVFEMASGYTVTLNSLTITNGYAPGDAGGGIANFGTLTVNQCTLAGNSALYGGGVYSEGTLTVNNSTLMSNLATNSSGGGGGIFNQGGTLILNQSTLQGNNASGSLGGGALVNGGTAIINQSTLTENNALNTLYNGGGILNFGTLMVSNSIVAGNLAAADPEIASFGGSVTMANNLTNGSPLLASIGNYGGPTFTMPPLAGSPAIDNGTDSATNTFAADQRGSGFPRLSGLHVDIGAVESAYAPSAPLVITRPATSVAFSNATLNATISPNGAVTAYYFEYGMTTNYGSFSATNTISAGTTPVDAPLNGLTLNTLYHFRAVATNGLGTTFGDDLIFSTLPPNAVINVNDSGFGSLRDTIAAATSGAVITFSSALSGQTIVLTSGEMLLTNNLTIDASALPNGIAINGNFAARIFNVASGSTNVLTGLTITNGFVIGANGGGIYNGGTLTMNECTIAGNVGSVDSDLLGGSFLFPSFGGGIYNNDSLTLNQCTLAGNQSTDGGGAIYNSSSGVVTVNQCTVASNASPSYPFLGLWKGGFAGGIWNNSGTISLTNTIAAGNTASNSPNMNGLFSGANNLITSDDPMLAPLGNYGGPTPTMLPLPGSPAIDNGTDAATNTFATEQRGLPRLSGLRVDIGAVESAYPPTPPLVVTQPATSVAFSTATLNATVTPNGAVTAYYFEYGPTTNYGAFTATNTVSAGAAVVDVSQSGLSPDTLYHFRAVAGNSSGTTFGDDLTFSTSHLNVVINTNDSGPGSLREAIASSGSGDGITFTNTLSGATILLTSGELLLTNNLIIDASALPNGIAIDGDASSRVFEMPGSNTVVLTALTITNGSTATSGGGIYSSGLGTLTLNQCTLAGNTADEGGGVYNYAGTLTLNQCTVTGNLATYAGGIYNSALYLNGTTYGTLALNQCTIASNSADSAGGILNYDGTLTVNQCTIAGNTAPSGGGGIVIAQTYASAVLSNTIVAGNTAPVGTNIYYFAGVFTGGNNLTNGDPLLAPLGNYGGPTPTMPPLAGSPAIDAGDDAAINTFGFDQRGPGFPRLSGLHVDIGAVEFQVAVIVATNPPVLTGLTVLGDGTFGFDFTNLAGASFTVFASTNVASPLNLWSNLGPAVETPPASGQFEFTDPQATNFNKRLYRVSSP